MKDGWIKYDAMHQGECPIAAGHRVEVEYATGEHDEDFCGRYDWELCGDWTIVAYRIVSKPTESDPNGLNAHTPGAKLDAGKLRPALVLGGFARALTEVCKVGTYGATKYTDNGWMEVPNGVTRYDDAKLRHWLAEKSGVECDADTKLLHASHEAWNALARLDLLLRQRESAHGLETRNDVHPVGAPPFPQAGDVPSREDEQPVQQRDS